jgi:cobalt-zinc-cadmium resistance protein CzcA
LLRPAGVGINTMTLGGLAIAVGLLVDAAIIVTENVVHRLGERRGGPRWDVVRDAAGEVAAPIVFATLIVIAVFLPLFAMSGIEGRMYQPLAAAVMASLAGSLLLALTFVPVLSGLVLRPLREGTSGDAWMIRVLRRAYAPMLDGVMKRPGLVQMATVAIAVPAVYLALAVGSDFMPRLDEGALLLQTSLPPDASLEEVDRTNHRVEDALRTFPEVDDVVRRTGRAERTEDPMPHTLSDVLVVLKPDPSRSLEELEAAMREELEDVPGVTVLFTTPLGMRIDEGLGGTPGGAASAGTITNPRQAASTSAGSTSSSAWRRSRPYGSVPTSDTRLNGQLAAATRTGRHGTSRRRIRQRGAGSSPR